MIITVAIKSDRGQTISLASSVACDVIFFVIYIFSGKGEGWQVTPDTPCIRPWSQWQIHKFWKGGMRNKMYQPSRHYR